MPRVFRRLLGYIGVAVVIAVFVAGFLAYFVYHTDAQTKVMHDGFGRPLAETPFFVRWVLDHDRLWAGWLWFIADMAVFWGGIALGIGLASFGFRGEEPAEKEAD